jgi:hypothetical protein
MMTFTDLASVPSDPPVAFTDQLRLAVAAYLARFTGSSREHTESDLRSVSESEPANDADLADGEHSFPAVHARGQGELGLGPPVGGVVGGGRGHSGGPSRVRWLRSVAPLAMRAYRLLWIGQTVSSAGDALVQVALVFAILHVGGTASDIGYVAAIQTVTRVTFILAGGVWADRLRRQFVMLASDTLRAAVQATLAVLLFMGQAHVWELGLGGAIYGAAQSFFGPASAGLVPETVPRGWSRSSWGAGRGVRAGPGVRDRRGNVRGERGLAGLAQARAAQPSGAQFLPLRPGGRLA